MKNRNPNILKADPNILINVYPGLGREDLFESSRGPHLQ